MLTFWVGGSEKVQNYADVIHGWSLIAKKNKKKTCLKKVGIAQFNDMG